MKFRKEGFFQALGITAYCALIGVFMLNANSLFGNIDNSVGPILFLLLFSTSVLICAVIVLLKPYRLFTAGKTKEAFEVVVSTAISLFIFLAVFLAALLVF